MIPQRRITVEEVREHAARTKRGWGRWRRTDAEGSESVMLLRPASELIECFCDGEVLTFGHKALTAHWTPLDYATEQPIAGHEDAWADAVLSSRSTRRVRWNGKRIVVADYDWMPPFCPGELAEFQRNEANRIAVAAGASNEYRIAVLRALIDATMAKRGCGTVSTHFNPCAGVGFQWSAHVRSNVPREGDDRRLAGTNPSAESERGTELEALEALALFIGAAS
jgi:hypothetical protein